MSKFHLKFARDLGMAVLKPSITLDSILAWMETQCNCIVCDHLLFRSFCAPIPCWIDPGSPRIAGCFFFLSFPALQLLNLSNVTILSWRHHKSHSLSYEPSWGGGGRGLIINSIESLLCRCSIQWRGAAATSLTVPVLIQSPQLECLSTTHQVSWGILLDGWILTWRRHSELRRNFSFRSRFRFSLETISAFATTAVSRNMGSLCAESSPQMELKLEDTSR